MNSDGGGVELYNIERDPRERHDRTATEPTIVKTLTAKLANWIAGLPAPVARKQPPM